MIDRALVLNPNLASAWFLGGFARVWNGELDGAIEHFARAMRLSPLDPEMYRMHAVWRCPECGFKTDCCGW